MQHRLLYLIFMDPEFCFEFANGSDEVLLLCYYNSRCTTHVCFVGVQCSLQSLSDVNVLCNMYI